MMYFIVMKNQCLSLMVKILCNFTFIGIWSLYLCICGRQRCTICMGRQTRLRGDSKQRYHVYTQTYFVKKITEIFILRVPVLNKIQQLYSATLG
jgi:hypothetical protein